MSQKIIKLHLALLLVLFLLPHLVVASFEISEIMYDLEGTDTNREWIEVHNTSTAPADLSKWYFFSDNTKHALVPQGLSEVPAGGYAVIAQNTPKFKADWSHYSGLLFDSSWTGFNNDSETIALKDPDQNIVSSVIFASSQGAAGDGNSLQFLNGSWSGAPPTPGKDNQPGSTNGVTMTSAGGGGASTSVSIKPVIKKEVEIPKITTNILSKNIVFSGLSFTVDAQTLGLSKEPLTRGKFVWNFGDGMITTLSEQKEFTYTYDYPGDYVLSLSYYSNYWVSHPDATDRMIIKVVSPEISISSVGAETDPYIELENKSGYEIDISNWTVQGVTHSFTIPGNTIMLPKNKLKFSPRRTGFIAEDLKSVTLQNPYRENTAFYPLTTPTLSKIKVPIQHSASVENKIQSIPNTEEMMQLEKIKMAEPGVIDLNTLGASADNAKVKISNNMLTEIGLIFIIIIAIASVILLRKKTSTHDDLDKGLTASDMTIIE